MENKGCCPTTGGSKNDGKGACDSKDGGKGKDCATKSCCAALLKGALLGGIVMFVYISASWMLIPWHKATLNGFSNEAAVAGVLLDNAPESGVYVLPHREDMKQEPAVKGPEAFVVVNRDGFVPGAMNRDMAMQFGVCLLLALMLTCLLKKQSCGCPVGFSVKIGLLAGLAHYLPGMIWFGYPCDYALVGVADSVLSFALAGLVISKLALDKGTCAPEKGACHK